MIKSFRDNDAVLLFEGKRSKRFRQIDRVVRRKLKMLAAAEELRDLMAPPGNRFEALRGNRRGQHSIRINDQYRICFVWDDGDAYNVEIVDYHD